MVKTAINNRALLYLQNIQDYFLSHQSNGIDMHIPLVTHSQADTEELRKPPVDIVPTLLAAGGPLL